MIELYQKLAVYFLDLYDTKEAAAMVSLKLGILVSRQLGQTTAHSQPAVRAHHIEPPRVHGDRAAINAQLREEALEEARTLEGR
jgi:hypothetical protein